jgi:hypothetical protein
MTSKIGRGPITDPDGKLLYDDPEIKFLNSKIAVKILFS